MSSEDVLVAARGTRDITAQSALNALLGAGLFMFLARILTKEELGLFNSLMLIITLGSIVGALGLDKALGRYIPYFKGKGSAYGSRLAVRRIATLALISSGLSTLAFFMLAPTLSGLLFGSERYVFLVQVSVLTVFPAALSFVAIGFLMGLKKFRAIATFRVFAQLLRIASTVALVLIGLRIVGIVLGWAFFYLLMVLAILPMLIRFLKVSDNPRGQNGLNYGEILGFSLPIVGMNLLSYSLNSIDQYVVLKAVGLGSLGSYSVVLTAATAIIGVMGTPLVTTLTPSLSELNGKRGVEGVSAGMRKAGHYISLFFIPVTFGLASLSPLALLILGGEKYVSASIPLTIISLSLATYGISALIVSALTAMAKTKTLLVVMALASSVELGAGMLLTPSLGLVGASLSRALMYCSLLMLLVCLGRRYIPMDFDSRSNLKSLVASSAMALATYSFSSLTGFSLILLPAYLLLALMVYVLVLSALKGLKKEDLKFFLKLLPAGISARLVRLAKSPTLSPLLERLLEG